MPFYFICGATLNNIKHNFKECTMNNLIKCFSAIIILFVDSQLFSQEIEFMKMRNEYFVPTKTYKSDYNRLPAGEYTVGNGGYFSTLETAFNELSKNGIGGNVTLKLIDEIYIATSDTFGFLLDGPITGASSINRITLQPANNVNVTIEGRGEAVLNFRNVSYFTIDGISLNGSTTLKIHSIQNLRVGWNDGISFLNNSKNNIVQNVIIECEDFSRKCSGIIFLHQSGNNNVNNNIIRNNFIKKAAIGINIASFFYRATGNIIRDNIIGSESDSLISIGINIVLGQKTLVDNNSIMNIRSKSSQIISNIGYCAGIASVATVSDTIRNNVIHNVSVDDDGCDAIGILLNGTSVNKGCINSVYNNMIYDIQSTSSNVNAKVSGIEIRNQNYSKVYFNSVYLFGSGSNQNGSAALYVDSISSNVIAINNIFINNRDDSPYCASAISGFSPNLTSDFNVLYCLINQYNYLVRCNCTNYKSLVDWQSSGQDNHSYMEYPHFIDPDLHIDRLIETYLESRGTPILGINYDFDLDSRNSITPDIGADEFDGSSIPASIEDEINFPTEIMLEQNFPNPFNPITTIRYYLPEETKVILKVYDILGSEKLILVDEVQEAGYKEMKFNGTGFVSGVLIYRLEANHLVLAKKMMLLK